MSDAVELQNVTKRYGDFVAVNDLSLSLPEGQITGFLGPNGAGKTTTIRMIMSILYPDTGSIRVLGHDRALAVKDAIGYLPEERGLYRKMTVEHTLSYLGRLKGLRGATLNARIDAALAMVGLQDWKKKPVEALSKGMSQKLQFAATVLHEPKLVILDEPFSGLDPLNMEALKDLMVQMKQRGATVIFSTHQMEQAQRLCDRLVLINRGRKLIDGPTAEIRARFAMRMVTIEGEGAFDAVAALPGVVKAQTTAAQAELELAADVDPNDLLQSAIQHVRVDKFEVHRPSLHDIFVKLVGEDQNEAAAAEADRALRTGEQPVVQEVA